LTIFCSKENSKENSNRGQLFVLISKRDAVIKRQNEAPVEETEKRLTSVER
jgi:glycerol-3-phosphate cytidylyltransferase-like family protein